MLRHQRSAKYCLRQQDEQSVTDMLECKYCQKVFYRTDNFAHHEKKCMLKGNEPVEKVNDKNASLLDKFMIMLKDIQQQNTTFIQQQNNNFFKQNNDLVKQMLDIITTKNNDVGKKNIVEDLQPITDADLSAYLDSLSLEFIQRGVQGYADYAGNYPFKGKIICTDRSRKKIQYKSVDGMVTADGRALAQRFFQAIEKKNTDLINKEYCLLQQKLENIVHNNNVGDEDVSDILTRASFIQNMLIKIQNAAQGKDDEFTQMFLSHLSKIAN